MFGHFIVIVNIINNLKLKMLIGTKFKLKHKIKINFIKKIYVFRLVLGLEVQSKGKIKLFLIVLI